MRIVALAVAIVLIGTFSPLAAQSLDDEGKFANAAFECAALAALSSKASGNQEHASDLALMALPKARDVALSAEGSTDPAKDGPLGRFMQSGTPDFWVGLMFAAASQYVTGLLPKAGESQELAADAEYLRRNCGLLLP